MQHNNHIGCSEVALFCGVLNPTLKAFWDWFKQILYLSRPLYTDLYKSHRSFRTLRIPSQYCFDVRPLLIFTRNIGLELGFDGHWLSYNWGHLVWSYSWTIQNRLDSVWSVCTCPVGFPLLNAGLGRNETTVLVWVVRVCLFCFVSQDSIIKN